MDLGTHPAVDHPSKRVKLSPEPVSSPVAMSNSMIEDDDDDDLYDSPVQPAVPTTEEARTGVQVESEASRDSSNNTSQLPGLNSNPERSTTQIATDAPPNGEDVEMDVPLASLPGLVEQERTTQAEANPNPSQPQPTLETPLVEDTKADGHAHEEIAGDADAAFVEAAVANKSDQAAEWQYDSSNDDTSETSSDSSDEDSDDSDDDDFHKLNLEEQARILMQGDGGSDDEGGKAGKPSAKNILRTTNEKPDEIVKPDVIITPEMEIQELGLVENVVESFVLIKGKVSGETRVLETGSVLCLEDRIVIGSVAEPIGRVDQPYYSVAFTDADSIKESGIEAGTKIFYVVSHSTYVFTQPLKAFKGSDASNQHDEEVAPDEIEFSDDEAEAEYKRSLKQEKLARKNALINARSGLDPSMTDDFVRTATEHEYPSQAMNYDDGDVEEELYTPLARPENFHALSAADRSFRGQRDARGQSHRGRGDGRQFDRGRGGGVRGRGRPNNRPRREGRGGRAVGHDMRGRGERSQQSMQTRPPNPQSPRSPNVPSPYSSHGQMSPQFPAYPGNGPAMPPQQWPPPAYGGQGQAYGVPQSPVSPVPPFSPGGTIPPGAFVNPAFFRGNQANSPTSFNPPAYSSYPNMQGPFSPYPSQYAPQSSYPNAQLPDRSWGRPEENGGRGSPGSEVAFQQAQEKLNLLRQLNHQPGAS